MKFIILALVAMVSVEAIAIKETDNWTEDSLHSFDDKHYPENKVNSLFPEHFKGEVRGDNPNCSGSTC